MSKKDSIETTAEVTPDPAPIDHTPFMVRVKDLTVHPLLLNAPRLAKKDPRYVVMRAGWEESGILPPILVTPDLQIVDGRHRYWYAHDQGLESIPAVKVSPDNVHSVIIGALAGRNHVTKSQKAYLAFPYLADAVVQARERRLAMLRSGGKTSLPPVDTLEDLAERVGVSQEYLRQAALVHEAFENKTRWDFNNPPAQAAAILIEDGDETQSKSGRTKRKLTFREYFEPYILAAEDPMPLGGVLKCVGYFLSPSAGKTAGKAPKRNSHLHMFGAAWKAMPKVASRWDKLSDEERDTAGELVTKSLSKMPDTLLEHMALKARQVLRDRTKTAAPGEADPS